MRSIWIFLDIKHSWLLILKVYILCASSYSIFKKEVVLKSDMFVRACAVTAFKFYWMCQATGQQMCWPSYQSKGKHRDKQRLAETKREGGEGMDKEKQKAAITKSKLPLAINHIHLNISGCTVCASSCQSLCVCKTIVCSRVRICPP